MKRLSRLKSPKVGSPSENPGFLLWHRSHAWQRTIDAALRPFDPARRQFSTLALTGWLGRNGDAVAQDISDFARLDRMLVSQVVRKLEEKGVVERLRRPDDRRAANVSPTDAGESVLAKSPPVVQAADTAFFASK